MVHKRDFEKDVVYLYQFPRAVGIPNISPYCIKLETWLRMAQVKYEAIDSFLDKKSREGTLPFVELNGIEYYDSQFAIEALRKELAKEDIDDWLTREQRGVAEMVYGTLDNSLTLVYAYDRSNDMDGFMKLFPKSSMPWLMQKCPDNLIKMFYKKKIRSRVEHSTIGKHKDEEIFKIGCRFLKGASDILGDKEFIFGGKPCTTDVVVFSHVVEIVKTPTTKRLSDFVQSDCANLVAHMERMIRQFWPDWDEIVAQPDPDPEPKVKGHTDDGQVNGEPELKGASKVSNGEGKPEESQKLAGQ